MPKIFLSHSSKNNAAAAWLSDWIVENGWDDQPFLDLDPERGIVAGERWQRALYKFRRPLRSRAVPDQRRVAQIGVVPQ